MEATSAIQQSGNTARPNFEESKSHRMNKRLIVNSAIVSIAIHLAWSSLSFVFLEQVEGIEDPKKETWMSALLPLGAILGSLPVGILADKFGRKYISWLSALPLFISWFIICFVKTKAGLYGARFFAGIGCGAASIVIPMYYFEISNSETQTRIVHIVNRAIGFGIFYPYAVRSATYRKPEPYVVPFEEPIILLTGLSSLFTLFLILLPESPMWLEDRGRKQEAEIAMKKITGTYVKLERTEDVKIVGNSGLRMSVFRTISNKKDIILILSLITLQQFSGIGPLTLHLKYFFDNIVHGDIMYWVYYIITFPIYISSLAMHYFERIGQKALLIISPCLMAICGSILAGYAYFSEEVDMKHQFYSCGIPMIVMMIYLSAFQVGLGPIPWMMIGRMFPSSSRRFMYNLAATYTWALLFITTKTFLGMEEYIGIYGILLLYVVINLFGTLFIIFVVPKKDCETQGELLENVA